MLTTEQVIANIRRGLDNTKHASARIKITGDTVDAEVDRRSRMVYGWATRSRKDMENEVILPDGIDDQTYFPKNIKTIYLNHNYEMPVGSCRRGFRKDDGYWLETYVTRTALGNDVLTMIEDEVIGHYSIGGIVTDYDQPTDEEFKMYGDDVVGVVRSMVLRETSLVAMPALPDAMLMGMDTEVDRCLGRIDNLLTKGRIQRLSAVMAGLDIPSVRKMYPVSSHTADDSGILSIVDVEREPGGLPPFTIG